MFQSILLNSKNHSLTRIYSAPIACNFVRYVFYFNWFHSSQCRQDLDLKRRITCTRKPIPLDIEVWKRKTEAVYQIREPWRNFKYDPGPLWNWKRGNSTEPRIEKQGMECYWFNRTIPFLCEEWRKSQK